MDKTVVLRPPYIYPGADPKTPDLTIDEMIFYSSCILPTKANEWKKGRFNHYSLPVYFNDKTKNKRRRPLIQFQSFSDFGLSLYQGDDSTQEPKTEEKEDPTDKKKKPRYKPLSIGFNADNDEDLGGFAGACDSLLKQIMLHEMDALKKTIGIKNSKEMMVNYKKTARDTPSSTDNTVRITCYPGSTELTTLEEHGPENHSMASFPQSRTGRYRVLLDLHHIDACYKENVLTLGWVLNGKKVALQEPETSQVTFEWRDNGRIEDSPDIVHEEVAAPRKKRKAKEEEKAKSTDKEKDESNHDKLLKLYQAKKIKSEESWPEYLNKD